MRRNQKLSCVVVAVVFLALPAFLAFPTLARSRITIENVRLMAFDKGITQIKKIELDDGIWEVKGDDATGHRIRLEVDAESGEIVKLKRH